MVSSGETHSYRYRWVKWSVWGTPWLAFCSPFEYRIRMRLLCMIKWIQLPAHSSRIKRIINAVFSLCYTLLIGCACYDWTLHDSVRALHLSLFIAKLCEMAFINCTRTFEFSTLIIINCRDESMHRFYIVVLLTEFSQLISDFIKFLSRNKDATKKKSSSVSIVIKKSRGKVVVGRTQPFQSGYWNIAQEIAWVLQMQLNLKLSVSGDSTEVPIHSLE